MTEVLETPVGRRRRVWLVGTAVVLVLLVVIVVVVTRTRPVPKSAPAVDADVLLTRVSFPRPAPQVTVTSVEAVTRGDQAFLRLTLSWSTEPDDSSDERIVPEFGAKVSHGGEYAGVAAACGLSAPQSVPADAPPTVVELPCSGLLVPDSVDEVVLTA